MRIVIAPNAFKGSLTAQQAADCMAEGLRQSHLPCELSLFPVADGGDETVGLLTRAMKGEMVTIPVHDPLGRPILGGLGWIPPETKALIGLSDASGLQLVKKEELDPLHANTYGTGELMKAALGLGAQELIVGVGGSATVDGGSGLLRALGVRFLDEGGAEISDLPIGLLRLHALDTLGMDERVRHVRIFVLCDVRNPLLGPQGAAHVFGPQKGAGEKEVILLEKCLERFNDITQKALGTDMADVLHGGAAGGAAAGLATFLNARLVSGIDFFLEELHFEEKLEGADLVLTGEGSLDEQTLDGKGPLGVALRSRRRGIPVTGIAGHIDPESEKALKNYFDHLISINPPGVSLQEAMLHTADNLTRVSRAWGNQLFR